MPPLPNVPNVMKIRLIWGVNAPVNVGTNLYWSYTGGPPAAADCTSIAGQVQAAVVSDLVSLLSQNFSLQEVICTDLSSPTGATGLNATGHLGTRVGANVPISSCVLLDHLINRRYRGGKPRSYLPFGVDADLNNQRTWAAALATSVNAGWASFVTAVNAANSGTTVMAAHVNVSYHKGFTVVTSPTTGRARNVPTLRATPVVDTITASTMNLKIGTQRRRLAGGG